MKTVLGAIGLKATHYAQHLRMAFCYPVYEVLIGWSHSMYPAIVFRVIVFLEVVDAELLSTAL